MANLKHVVSDLHEVYLTEMEAKIKPQMGKETSASSSSADGEKKAAGGGGESDNVQKSARQLAYDTRYKARREGIPLERAFTQAVQNSSASAPVKDAAKAMLFRATKEDVETEGDSIQEVRKGDKEMVRVTPKKGYGDQKGYVRFASNKKKKELRDNPQIQSVTPTSHGEPYEGKYKLKPGEKKNTKGDLDGDGTKEPDKHEYAGVKDKAIKAAMKKQKKESFSNWKTELGIQEDLVVEAGSEKKEKKIAEKNVNNTIVINPELKEAIANIGGEVLEVDELTQEQVEQIVKESLGALEELGIDIKSIVDEAVYGGTPKKKEEPKDTRYTVTNADKKGNTQAYQNYKKGMKSKVTGKPMYKAADHMDEESNAKK